jgi:hypothetical protein
MRVLASSLFFLICACHTGESVPAVKGASWEAIDAATMDAAKAEVSKRVGKRFDVLVSGPWILATDLDRWTAKAVLDEVVDGAALRVRNQLFPHARIQKPVVLYVLKDVSSYMSSSQRFFQEVPPTALGYYDRRQSYILTHAGRGFGPLLHEMVHVLAESDYPEIPPWLNEAMGSLFEEYAERDGTIVGVLNWRMFKFRQDLTSRRAASLRTMFKLDYKTLYGENTLSYYTALRHTMLWLQEQGKAGALYASLRDGKFEDPEKALCALFDNRFTLDEIERDIRLWAQAQRFEPTPSGPAVGKASQRFR